MKMDSDNNYSPRGPHILPESTRQHLEKYQIEQSTDQQKKKYDKLMRFNKKTDE